MSMQLLQKNTRFLLIRLPLVLFICSAIFFIMLKMHANHMQEKQLLLKQTNVWKAFVDKSGNIDRQIKGEYDITELPGNAIVPSGKPRDTLLYYEGSKSTLPFMLLARQFHWQHNNYLLTTYTSSSEVSHLIIKVFATEALILLLLLVTIIILNRKSSRNLWKPFFSTMEKINDYDITRLHPLNLPAETGTTEFNELNKAVAAMINNANTAYHHQKQFVENASHEMQTPLAIIRSKLELLINQPDLTERNASLLADITEANNRLSQMNRTLLLLAKIENNQFPETAPINLSKLLNKTVTEFKNYYDNFPVTNIQAEEQVVLMVNPSLIEIMVNNLLKNAIIHNLPAGKINIMLHHSGLFIENTGLPPALNPEELFERFKKGSHETKTTGLGLALVRQICNVYQFKPAYSFDNGWHRVSITFA